MSVSAQKINTDSLSLVSKISTDQLKLGKLQNQIKQKTKNQQNASAQAQQSANENSTAANKLSDNPENKKLARRANNKAGDARSDSRNARRESNSLDKLNKDIQDLKNRISNNQAKLNMHIQKGSAGPATTDAIQH
jgi:chromosome segregation ATPase